MEPSTVDRPTRKVLLQRVRNRIIDYLEVAASFEEQLKYQSEAPNVDVPNEVINQWEDWVGENWEVELVGPVFSDAERRGIREFHALWRHVIDQTPDPLPKLDVLVHTSLWELLRDGASRLGQVFSQRGRLSEECEDV